MYSPSRGQRHSSYRGGYASGQGSPWMQQGRGGRPPMQSPHQTPPGGRGRYYTDQPLNQPYRGRPRQDRSPYGPPRQGRPSHGPPMTDGSPYGPMRANSSPYGPMGPEGSPYGNVRPDGTPYGPPRQTTPRHSTPFGRGAYHSRDQSMSEFFTPHQSPMQRSANDSSYFTPPESLSSMDSSYGNSGQVSSDHFGNGQNQNQQMRRGGRPYRRHLSDSHDRYGKRPRMDFKKTLPGTLLKTAMLEDPWKDVVPMKCPEDGLVLTGGQRHSVLTPGKAAAVAATAAEKDKLDANDEKIDLTD